MPETVHYVTHQELWLFIGAGITLISIIVGVIMNIVSNSNKANILRQVSETKDSFQKDINIVKDDMDEIKNNYIEKFDEVKKEMRANNRDILIALAEIKTKLEYMSKTDK